MSSKFYSFVTKTLNGKDYSFSQLKGKVVLIVNVASECKYTPQYKSLELLKQKYNSEGFEIIGFPCNQFNNEDPGTNSDISKFA